MLLTCEAFFLLVLLPVRCRVSYVRIMSKQTQGLPAVLSSLGMAVGAVGNVRHNLPRLPCCAGCYAVCEKVSECVLLVFPVVFEGDMKQSCYERHWEYNFLVATMTQNE